MMMMMMNRWRDWTEDTQVCVCVTVEVMLTKCEAKEEC